MGILETRNSMCNKLISEFGSISSTISTASNAIESTISSAKSLLNGMVFSPGSILEAAILDFKLDIMGNLPSFENNSLDEIMSFINSCVFLNGTNPISMVYGLKTSCMNGIFDKINSLADTIPEFNAGGALNNIINQFSGFGLTDGMKNLDSIINCVNSLCPGFSSQLSTMVAEANGLYSKLGMVSNPLSANYGTLDTDAIYSAAGLGPDKINAMTNTMDSITEMTETTYSTISSGVELMKIYVIS
jgi:hypothetical protein